VDSIAAQMQETESNLKASRTSLSYTKIFAPMAGTVTTLPTKEGQTLNANQTAPTVLQIASLDIMTVRAQVAEADVSRLKPNMPAYFTTLGNSERRWPGKVRQILPTPQIVNDVVLYDVLIDVKNEGRHLMTSMTTQVFFILGKADNALIVPAEVLTQRAAKADSDKGTAYRVSLVTPTGREPRSIHGGLLTRTQAEGTDGLTDGDQIATRRPSGGTASTPAGGGPRRNSPRTSRGPQLRTRRFSN
jgi:macrolide-specific efflux system membrane fusion protein